MFNALPILLASLIAVAPVAGAQAATVSQQIKPASSAPVATPGKMLIDASGSRLGQVDRVDADGSVELILDGRVVTVPAGTLSVVNGKLTTSLKKDALL